MGKEELSEVGNLGREWVLSEEAGFTSENMAKRIMSNMNVLLNKWQPREKYELIKVGSREIKSVPHKLEY